MNRSTIYFTDFREIEIPLFGGLSTTGFYKSSNFPYLMMTKKHLNLSSEVNLVVTVGIKINVNTLILVLLLNSTLSSVCGGVIESTPDSNNSTSLTRGLNRNQTSSDMSGTPVVIAATAKHTATVSQFLPSFLSSVLHFPIKPLILHRKDYLLRPMSHRMTPNL